MRNIYEVGMGIHASPDAQAGRVFPMGWMPPLAAAVTQGSSNRSRRTMVKNAPVATGGDPPTARRGLLVMRGSRSGYGWPVESGHA
jgi:hypothetical protein